MSHIIAKKLYFALTLGGPLTITLQAPLIQLGGMLDARHRVLRLLRHHWFWSYRTLTDFVISDYPLQKHRFCLTYNLLSSGWVCRIWLNYWMGEESSVVTAQPWYPGANWLEREAWDLFGVFVEGHNDLRRLLTDYGFHGHPLRKDFPLSGFVEVFYDERKKTVTYTEVSLAQEYRNFRHLSPWQGAFAPQQ